MNKLAAILVAGLICASTSSALAASDLLIGEGARELRVSGGIVAETPAGEDFSLQLGYGVFLVDNFLVGGQLGFSDNDVTQTYDLGVYTEYNFDTLTWWIPYVGAELSWSSTDPTFAQSADALVFTFVGGIKYFLSSNVAIFGALNFDFATDDIYIDNELDANSYNYDAELGLRVYFGD